MSYHKRMLVAGAAPTAGAARGLARAIGGTAYTDNREDPSRLPFAGLTVGATDDIGTFRQGAEHGVYLICERTIKPGSANYYGLFPMLRHPQKSHAETDAHWRDTHGPLALEHHIHMTHYLQLSVVETLSGTPYDGFALCGFDTVADLKERFYTTEESIRVIAEDVAKFADVGNSPRRLIAEPTFYTDD